MKLFVFVTVIALVHARPEAGYVYNKPTISFTGGHGSGYQTGGSIGNIGLSGSGVGIGVAPSAGGAGLLTQSFGHGDATSISGGHSFSGGSSFSSGSSFQTGGVSSLQSGGVSAFHGGSSLTDGASSLIGGPSFTGGASSLTGGSSFTGGSSSFTGGSSSFTGGSSSFGSSSFTGGDASFGGQAGTTLVQKHIYVHVPPPEPEDIRPQRPISVAPAQKHYKIIFIKAPAPPTPTAPVIPLQPQNEEKTLVYVLVKRPDEQPDIHIPTPAPTQPSKPEVYFIKYKTQKEVTSTGGGVVDHGTTGASGIVSNVQTGGAVTGPEYNLSQSSSSLSSSSSSSSSSAALSTSYGPPGHQPGPY